MANALISHHCEVQGQDDSIKTGIFLDTTAVLLKTSINENKRSLHGTGQMSSKHPSINFFFQETSKIRIFLWYDITMIGN